MKAIKILIVLFIFLIFSNLLYSQSNVIAKVGNENIYKEVFKIRYELSPRVISNNTVDPDSIKLYSLYSLISEKLWAMEAIDLGLNNSDDFNFYFTPVKKMYVRDELFKSEIKNKVQVNNSDIKEGLINNSKILKVRTISSDDSNKIFEIYANLIITGTLDSLLKVYPEINKLTSTFEVNFGDLNDESLEEELYKLKINQYTIPEKNLQNWFIFEILGSKPKVIRDSRQKVQKNVEKIIRNRRIQKLYNEFYKKYFSDYTLIADKDKFLKISEEFYNVVNERIRISPQKNDSSKIYITDDDILQVKDRHGNEFLNSILFKTKYGDVTIYDFLSDLSIVDVGFNQITQTSVNKVLANKLKIFMQQETIYLLALTKGIQYSKEVQSRLNLWKENLLAQILRNKFNSRVRVSDAEIDAQYNEVFSDSSIFPQFKVQSLTISNVNELESVYGFIQNGESFEQITNKFSRGGSITIKEISDPGELNISDDVMNIIDKFHKGGVYGPVKTTKGFTFYKVLDHTILNDSLNAEMKNKHNLIYQKLYSKKLNAILNNKTVELANKYGIMINEGFLHTEHFSEINFFVHQLMGFGGRIAAVPYVTPMYQWFYKWKNQPGKNP